MDKEAVKRAEDERILFHKRRDDKAYKKGIEKQTNVEAIEERQRKPKINIEVQSLGLAYNRPRRKVKKPSYFSL